MKSVALFDSGGRGRQILFDRREIEQIMQLYGRMVAAGMWRDYAFDMGRTHATFSAFRRAAERPEFRLVKEPERRLQQGQYTLLGEAGQVLKRGNDLRAVLAPAMRRLIKAVG